jgi:hypothetical protein
MPKKTQNIKATKKRCAIFVSNKHLLEILLVGNLDNWPVYPERGSLNSYFAFLNCVHLIIIIYEFIA